MGSQERNRENDMPSSCTILVKKMRGRNCTVRVFALRYSDRISWKDLKKLKCKWLFLESEQIPRAKPI